MKKSQGSVIIALIFAVSLILIMLSFFQQQSARESIARSNIKVLATSLLAKQASIRSIFSDAISKNLIINDTAKNPNLLACKTASCPVSSEQNLVTYDQSGTVYSDNSDSQGFTTQGIPCNNFNATSGNDACPYRYKIVWIPDCPPGIACSTPSILIKASVEFKPSSADTTNILNLGRFDFMTAL